MGTVHGEELPYFFGAPLVDGFNHFPKNYTRSELALAEAVIICLANFARTGWVLQYTAEFVEQICTCRKEFAAPMQPLLWCACFGFMQGLELYCGVATSQGSSTYLTVQAPPTLGQTIFQEWGACAVVEYTLVWVWRGLTIRRKFCGDFHPRGVN